jgi:peptidoglycan/xylan/chitin deacetylase (PgdA/CDA1 family)
MTRGLPDFVVSSTPGELSGIPVFCYHQISGPTFESHLRFLHANDYTTVTADEFLSLLQHRDQRSRLDAKRRRVVISFDDGLADLHDTIFPLLRRYDTRVVAFISPAFHAGNRSSVSEPDGLSTCSWLEIETMHASGLVDFQSHTFEHRLVRRWPKGVPLAGTRDPDCERRRGPALRLDQDLARARDAIETRLGKRVRHLAFPQYDGTPEAVRIGRACGYDAFYWGMRPWKPINAPGDDFSCIVRLSGEFLPRLPGAERLPLATILRHRYARCVSGWAGRFSINR